MTRCPNSEIASQLLEESVFAIIRDSMSDPFKLRARLEYASKEERTIEPDLRAIKGHSRGRWATGETRRKQPIVSHPKLRECRA
jgi:hypothetical protein